ncbi:RluA family pseudouridine synthase [Inhella sp.]|uniref:RluA family pseudouridine synthase n=1 Tax=Inhella sp. TaxID=1921806 RepID=UPI0035AD8893
MASALETRVPPAWQGMRLDRALALWQPESSRSHLQQLVEEGALQVDGEPCPQVSRKLRLGQRLQLAWRPPDAMLAFVAEPMELPIVFEDAQLLVIDKPAGLVVHPAAGNWRGTLMNGLLAHHAAAVHLPRAGIVHRLDKDTSGLMVVAKTQVAYDLLVAQLAAREVRREYLALAKGAWGEPRCVDEPVGRDPRQRVRMAVVAEGRGGKPAQTDVEALVQSPRASLLHCSLRTGRTHQIRVHCAYAGHPLFGDTLYGGPTLAGLQRQALHAARLTLHHPADGRVLQWVSPPHEDFHQAATVLGFNLSWP